MSFILYKDRSTMSDGDVETNNSAAKNSSSTSTLNRRRLNWRLFVCVAVPSMYTMNSGGMLGYPSPALPDLNRRPNPFHLTADQQSWVGSLMSLGAAVGGLISGPISDLVGRKVAMMFSLFVVVGLTVIAAANNYRHLYGGIFMTAVFAQISITAATLYTAEVVPADIRGMCMSLTTMTFSIGMVVSYSMGLILPWNWLAIFLAALFAAPNVVLAFLPESPRWFLVNGNVDAAVHGVRWIRGYCDMDEIRAIERSLDDDAGAGAAAVAGSSTGGKCCDLSTWRELLANRDNRRSLLVCSALFILQGFSGNITLQMFTVAIFELAGVTGLDPNVQTIIVGTCCVVGGALCPLLVDRVGRKLLMMSSALLVSVSMTMAATFFHVLKSDAAFARDHLYLLPVFGLSLSNLGFMAGMLPVPSVLGCEMFPTNVRGRAQTVLQLFQGLSSFGCLKTFIYIQAAVGVSGAFYMYATISMATVWFVAFFVQNHKASDMQ